MASTSKCKSAVKATKTNEQGFGWVQEQIILGLERVSMAEHIKTIDDHQIIGQKLVRHQHTAGAAGHMSAAEEPTSAV